MTHKAKASAVAHAKSWLKSIQPCSSFQALAICRRLEGLPLGIELAATWIELPSPAEH